MKSFLKIFLSRLTLGGVGCSGTAPTVCACATRPAQIPTVISVSGIAHPTLRTTSQSLLLWDTRTLLGIQDSIKIINVFLNYQLPSTTRVIITVCFFIALSNNDFFPKVDSWWQWSLYHCSYCLCLCEDNVQSSERFFSLREATADVEKSKSVITDCELIIFCGILTISILHCFELITGFRIIDIQVIVVKTSVELSRSMC